MGRGGSLERWVVNVSNSTVHVRKTATFPSESVKGVYIERGARVMVTQLQLVRVLGRDIVFMKLAEHNGWICDRMPVTETILFDTVSASQLAAERAQQESTVFWQASPYLSTVDKLVDALGQSGAATRMAADRGASVQRALNPAFAAPSDGAAAAKTVAVLELPPSLVASEASKINRAAQDEEGRSLAQRLQARQAARSRAADVEQAAILRAADVAAVTAAQRDAASYSSVLDPPSALQQAHADAAKAKFEERTKAATSIRELVRSITARSRRSESSRRDEFAKMRLAFFPPTVGAPGEDDGSVGLTMQVFKRKFRAYLAARHSHVNVRDVTLSIMFDAIDVDGNEQLSRRELLCGLVSLLDIDHVAGAKLMFDACDTRVGYRTGDGLLQLAEFAIAFRSVAAVAALLDPAAFQHVDSVGEVGQAQARAMFQGVLGAESGSATAGISKSQFVAWFATVMEQREGDPKAFAAATERQRLADASDARAAAAAEVKAEVARRAAEEAQAEEARRAAEEAQAEETRRAAEEAQAEEARRTADEAQAEEARRAAEEVRAEEARRAADEAQAEEARRAAEEVQAVEARRAAEEMEEQRVADEEARAAGGAISKIEDSSANTGATAEVETNAAAGETRFFRNVSLGQATIYTQPRVHGSAHRGVLESHAVVGIVGAAMKDGHAVSFLEIENSGGFIVGSVGHKLLFAPVDDATAVLSGHLPEVRLLGAHLRATDLKRLALQRDVDALISESHGLKPLTHWKNVSKTAVHRMRVKGLPPQYCGDDDPTMPIVQPQETMDVLGVDEEDGLKYLELASGGWLTDVFPQNRQGVIMERQRTAKTETISLTRSERVALAENDARRAASPHHTVSTIKRRFMTTQIGWVHGGRVDVAIKSARNIRDKKNFLQGDSIVVAVYYRSTADEDWVLKEETAPIVNDDGRDHFKFRGARLNVKKCKAGDAPAVRLVVIARPHPDEEGSDFNLGFIEFYFCGVPTVCLSSAARAIEGAASPMQQIHDKDYGPTFFENEWVRRQLARVRCEQRSIE